MVIAIVVGKSPLLMIETLGKHLGIYSRWVRSMLALFSHTHVLAVVFFALELQGTTIQPIGDLFKGLQYEAYSTLIDFYHAEEPLSFTNYENFPIDSIKHSLRIEGDRFRYKLYPRLVSDMVHYLKPFIDSMFSLPSEWQFSRYSLGEFRKVFEVICAISHIHFSARGLAVTQGCHNLAMPTAFSRQLVMSY